MPERYDAILVHGYQLRENPNPTSPSNRIRSSLRAHMQVAALTELIGNGQVENIFLAGGNIWGPNYPAAAEILAGELESRLQRQKIITPPNVVLVPKALTTDEEIDLFLEESKKQNWTHVASLANKTHTSRIKHIYHSKRGKNVKIIEAEDVIQDVEFRGRRPYRPFVEVFRWSRFELAFVFREAIARIAYNIGLEKRLRERAKKSRQQKVDVWFDK